MLHNLKNFIGMSVKRIITNYRKKEDQDAVFLNTLKEKITGMENNTVLYKGKSYAKNSVSNYKKILRIWPEFERTIGAENLRFSEITLDTYSKFMDFCNRCNYNDSTKYQYISLVKAIMNTALEEGKSNSTIQNRKGFATHNADSIYKKVYLTRNEISDLAGLNLDNKPMLMKVRDIFLVGCYCGQRFSDYSCITLDDIETICIDGREFKIIRKIQKKTGRPVIIPILDGRLVEIIKRWGGTLPRISISTLNVHIKNLCRMAGIDGIVVINHFIGGKRVREVKHKYELISSHTARRSYITNLYMEGKLSNGQIRSISGHSSEESFKRYLCQNQEEEAMEIIRKYIGVR